MNTNAHEEEQKELEDNIDTDETLDSEGESEEVSEEHLGEETEETGEEDSISVSRAEYQKLQRESAAAKRLREKASKQGSQESKERPELDQELISRTYLAAQAGIKDKEVQDEALRLAEKFGMNIAEAVSDSDISTRLTNLQKRKEAQKAVAKSTGGSTSRTKDTAYYLSYFKQHGDFPAGTPSSMIAKVAGELAND